LGIRNFVRPKEGYSHPGHCDLKGRAGLCPSIQKQERGGPLGFGGRRLSDTGALGKKKGKEKGGKKIGLRGFLWGVCKLGKNKKMETRFPDPIQTGSLTGGKKKHKRKRGGVGLPEII